MKPCSRCGLLFRAYHGNQLYCGSCRQKRSFRPRRSSTPALGVRICAFCRMPYQARAENQRYCSKRCKGRAKPAAVSAKYARPSHRLGRKAWKPAVATGSSAALERALQVRASWSTASSWAASSGWAALGSRPPRRRVARRAGACCLQSSGTLPTASASDERAARSTAEPRSRSCSAPAGEPVAVLCDPEGDPPGQRWFAVVLDDSPGPDSEPQAPVCVDCLSRSIRSSGRACSLRSRHRRS